MKTLCIYHSRDLDGWMSAAIVKKHHLDYYLGLEIFNHTGDIKIAGGNSNNQLYMLGWDYNDDIPNTNMYDRVIMCDVSFPKEEMLSINLRLGVNFIWIDHHQRSIDEINKLLISNGIPMNGLVTINGELKAACELTWELFYPHETMPEIVRLLGRYDCFGHKGTHEERKVLEFQYGARQTIENYEDAYRYLIDSLVNHNSSEHDIHNEGASIYQYLLTEAKQIYAKAFEVKFTLNNLKEANSYNMKLREGANIYKFLCVNHERFNPINFGINYHKDGYAGFACFWLKDNKWIFSLYNDDGSVDCSAIAKSFGGGGHKGAAGFVIEDINKLKLILDL